MESYISDTRSLYGLYRRINHESTDPSEDDIVERVRTPKEQIGVWDKTTATLEKNMEKALEAMASYALKTP